MRTFLFVAALLCFLLLVGCTLITEALRATGVISPSSGMMEAAKAVDDAIGGWLRDLLFMGAGAATTEGTRATVKHVKARRLAKAGHKS